MARVYGPREWTRRGGGGGGGGVGGGVVFAGEERGGGRTKVALQKERAQIASRGNWHALRSRRIAKGPKGFARV